MTITAALVKELRDLTGAGMMDCKKALQENDGDIQKSIDWLREQGIAKSAKKSGRIAAEGLSRVKVDGNKACLIEVNSETDFVAQNEQFLSLLEKTVDAVLANSPANMEEALNINVDGSSLSDLFVEATATIGEKISFRRFEILENRGSIQNIDKPYFTEDIKLKLRTVYEISQFNTLVKSKKEWINSFSIILLLIY